MITNIIKRGVINNSNIYKYHCISTLINSPKLQIQSHSFKYFCTTTNTTIIPNNILINNVNKAKEDIDDQEEESDIQCIDEKCSIIFKIPGKLRGQNGYCPKCASAMPFKKHTSNYKRILKKRREKYLNTLGEEIKNENSFDPIKNKPTGLSVILEDCRSLHNVGSIFRTSDGAGFNHIYLCGLTGTPPNEQISKSSLGAENMISWSFSNDTQSVIKSLKQQHNVIIVGIEQTSNSVSLFQSLNDIESLIKYKNESTGQLSYRPITILMGNEVAGLSNEAIELCDIICELPMKGNKKSLNVSITYGIVSFILSNHFNYLSTNVKS